MSAIFGNLFSKKEKVIEHELCITNGTAIDLNTYLAHTGPSDVRNVRFADDIMGDRNELFVYSGAAEVNYSFSGNTVFFTRKKASPAARANAAVSQTEAYSSDNTGTDKEAILRWIRENKARVRVMPGYKI